MRKQQVKSFIAMLVCCSTVIASTTACGGGTGAGVSGFISTEALKVSQLGEGFGEEYLPNTAKIKQYSGKIDVCLDFEGTQGGWQALADEYQRLQGKSVVVNINTNYSGSTYSQRLNDELTNENTDWDIVEGNLGYGSTYTYCIDMRSSLSAPNPYCGATNASWADVLESIAYKTKEADNSGVSYILNSEVMQTCWFVNDVAFNAAVEKGYKNLYELPEYPVTWDDLIFLCEKMKEAGYDNPLGISLSASSIESLQFSWLLRVYGDYYYRQFYQYIMAGEAGSEWENYDKKANVVENNAGYGVKYAKLLNMLFETDCNFGAGYVGYTSEVYRDMVGQLAKMKGYLMKNVSSTDFGPLRDQFESQGDGKESPQILLDYQGFGIKYEQAEKEGNFELGYFDYPQMISGEYQAGKLRGEKIVDIGTTTRDIGGNGGFLSIINHLGDATQNELNKDFIKFVMSPYGQTIYYQGLAKSNAVPKGLSSVKNDLVVIPSEWKSFFDESNKTITFSGDVDANPFLGWGVRYALGETATQKVICEYWRNLLMEGLAKDQELNVNSFAAKWDTAVRTDVATIVAKNGWPNEFWKNPNYNL